jgi:uncharacterized Zn finger protein
MAKRSIPITVAKLKRATDGRSWQRGEKYFQQGRVRMLLADGDVLVAKVSGTRDYRVRLWADGDGVAGECSCPVGPTRGAGGLCKHCVAVGLAYLGRGADTIGDDGVPPGLARLHMAKPAVSLDDVREYLANQDRDHLVKLLMEQVVQDDHLRESLLMEVARRRPEGLDLATFRRAIDNATDPGLDGFVGYREAYGFARGIDSVVESIADLLKEGRAAEVIDLAEYALESCQAAYGRVDDSDGGMHTVMERLGEIHHDACLAARPDPEKLARRLFRWELEEPSDVFYRAAEKYADVLGEEGLAAYRRLAEDLWARAPQLGPGQRQERFEGHRSRLESIMESLARADGDVEALVAVKSRDLSSSYRYLEIAEIYRKARKRKKALEWAERGLRGFPGDFAPRLEDFLAEQYHRLDRHDEAMALIWGQFARYPGLDAYQHLHEHAERVGAWPAWRKKALEHVEAEIGKQSRGGPGSYRGSFRRADHSLLVEIFLWENEPEKAWKEAQAGGCSDVLWLRLAKRRERTHPADAVGVYQPMIEPIVSQTGKSAYEQAAALIRKIAGLMKRLGRNEQFGRYLESLRSAHKRKRSFVAMLERIR